ncbi:MULTISPECIES: hypothetical protein [unclassified Streptomyces]|uniref:hypothetical protein n=1 Tax=unclassified Streptomyces TaxID=2593676 RepID=UPI00340AC7AF
MLVLQRELVDGSDECGDVGAELIKCCVLVRDRLLELRDRLAEADFDVWCLSALLDPRAELVLQVEMPLGEGISWDVGFLGESDDGEGAVGCL